MIQNLSQRPTSNSFFGGIRDAISNFGKRNAAPAPAETARQTGFCCRDEFTAKPATGARPAPGTAPATGGAPTTGTRPLPGTSQDGRSKTPGASGDKTTFFQNQLEKFLNSRFGKTGWGKAFGKWMKAMYMPTKPLLPPPNTLGV